jgi:replicative DNA helicase
MIANVEAENVVLAAMLIDSGKIDRIADIVQPEDFVDPLLARLFLASRDSYFAGKACGAVALNSMFADDDAYKQAGGFSLLANLTGNSVALIGAMDLAKQVSDLAKRRRIAEGMADAMDMVADQSVSLSEVVEHVDTAMSSAAEQSSGISFMTGAGCLDAMMAQLDSKDRGVTCKVIPPMDDLLGGARRKQVIVLAARPGMGKTAVALSYSLGAAQNGHGVLYISLEMSGAELGARMAADLCFDGDGGVYYGNLVNQDINPRDRDKIKQARQMLADMPIEVVDASSLSVHRLGVMVRRYARRFAAKGERLDLVVVDYLQLLSADKGKSAYEAVSQISRALKAIAKEHDVAVLALAQLSREVEKRPGCRPQLSDLRDSGQIEQDADTVMFLLRKEYYLSKEKPEPHSADHMKWEQAMQEHKGKIEFICAKRRNGVTGAGEGAFHGAYQAVRGL